MCYGDEFTSAKLPRLAALIKTLRPLTGCSGLIIFLKARILVIPTMEFYAVC